MSTPRLFKFRIWHPTAGKMFYSSDDDPFFYGHEAPDGGDCLINLGRQDCSLHLPKYGRVFSRDPNQVCEQWTGLTDRDGKDIFEGDICEEGWPASADNMEGRYVVRFGAYEDGEGFPSVGFYTDYTLSREQREGQSGGNIRPNNMRWKVIGNVHQNAELLT